MTTYQTKVDKKTNYTRTIEKHHKPTENQLA